jgi:type II secretory pathway component PulM
MNAQIRALQARYTALWQARGRNERLIIAGSVAIVAIGLCVWLMYAADRSRAELRTVTVPALRERAGLLERQAAEYERLRAAPAAAVSPTDLRALVQAQAGTAGLSKALQSVEAAGANQVKVVFGVIAFADWLNWVQSLESQHIHLEACRIEALSTPGLVSVAGTLVRPGQQ